MGSRKGSELPEAERWGGGSERQPGGIKILSKNDTKNGLDNRDHYSYKFCVVKSLIPAYNGTPFAVIVPGSVDALFIERKIPMDKNELYEKAEKAFNQAFELTKHSVKIISEKAGEAAHITKLMIEKASLEHRVTKKFAQIGSRVYESSAQGGSLQNQDSKIGQLIEETRQLDTQLSQVDAELTSERGKRK